MVSVYGAQDKSESEWRTFWRIYTDTLDGLPLSAISAGVKEFMRQEKAEFFPKPGPLYALCRSHAEAQTEIIVKRHQSPQVTQAWSWPDDDTTPTRRDLLIMAHQCRGKAGAMLDDGTHPRPEWIERAKIYEAGSRACP